MKSLKSFVRFLDSSPTLRLTGARGRFGYGIAFARWQLVLPFEQHTFLVGLVCGWQDPDAKVDVSSKNSARRTKGRVRVTVRRIRLGFDNALSGEFGSGVGALILRRDSAKGYHLDPRVGIDLCPELAFAALPKSLLDVVRDLQGRRSAS